MNVLLLDTINRIEVYAEIKPISKKEFPKLKDGWKFTWSKLYESNAQFYGVIYKDKLQGIIKLRFDVEGFVEMSNLELSPSNFGSKGRFENVSGCLIAYACLKSFELGQGNYRGYISFKSKGELIEHYAYKYYAELVFREQMIIAPTNGLRLIQEYLKLEL